MISKSKIVLRIQQIESSIDQARMMLDAMNKIKNLVVKKIHHSESIEQHLFSSSRIMIINVKNSVLFSIILKIKKQAISICCI